MFASSFETGGKTQGDERASWIRLVEQSQLFREIAKVPASVLRFDVTARSAS